MAGPVGIEPTRGVLETLPPALDHETPCTSEIENSGLARPGLAAPLAYPLAARCRSLELPAQLLDFEWYGPILVAW